MAKRIITPDLLKNVSNHMRIMCHAALVVWYRCVLRKESPMAMIELVLALRMRIGITSLLPCMGANNVIVALPVGPLYIFNTVLSHR